MDLTIAAFSVLILAIILVLGKWVRIKVKLLQRLFLPTSLIAGFIALILGPEILGRLLGREGGIFTSEMVEVWASLPGLLINIVFACLFIGFKLPNPKKCGGLVGRILL